MAGRATRLTLPALLEATGRPVILGFDWLLAAMGIFARAIAALPGLRRGPAWLEFTRMLRLALPGSIISVLAASLLVGAALIGQALYWLTFAGQSGLIRTLMVNVLTREVAPMLVALVLLARIGTLNLVELAAIRSGAAWRCLAGQGMDPWQLLAAPRAFAAGIAGFAHTILAILAASVAGHVMALFLGASTLRPIQFLTSVLDAMTWRDFLLVALKGPALGFTVALATAAVAIASQRLSANLSMVLARGFSAGAVAALLVSLLLSGLL